MTDPLLGCTRPPAYALRADLLRAVGADPLDDAPTATVADADALRAAYVAFLTARLATRQWLPTGVDA